MRWRPVLAAAAAALVLVTGGCTETPAVRVGGPATPTDGSSVGPSVGPSGAPGDGSAAASSPALAAQKAATGIADCPRSAAEVAPVADGLPDLRLRCLGGGRDVRLAGLRGTPTVVNVWAQWCPPCRSEAPYLAAVAGDAGDRVRFLGIDYADPYPDLALDFAGDAGWTYPQLSDPERQVTAGLGILAAPPQTLFVAADGTLAYVHVGAFTSAEQLRTAVAAHLGVQL